MLSIISEYISDLLDDIKTIIIDNKKFLLIVISLLAIYLCGMLIYDEFSGIVFNLISNVIGFGILHGAVYILWRIGYVFSSNSKYPTLYTSLLNVGLIIGLIYFYMSLNLLISNA